MNAPEWHFARWWADWPWTGPPVYVAERRGLNFLVATHLGVAGPFYRALVAEPGSMSASQRLPKAWFTGMGSLPPGLVWVEGRVKDSPIRSEPMWRCRYMLKPSQTFNALDSQVRVSVE